MFNNKEVFFTNDSDSDSFEDAPEFLPLFSKQEEDESNKLEVPAELAVLTMRNTVLYPGVIFPITVGRDKSIRLIKDANKRDKIIAVVAQKNPSVEDPSIDDLYNVGTLAQIVRMMRMPDGSSTVILQGKRRIKIDEYTQTEPYFRAKVSSLPDLSAKESKEYKATIDSIRDISHKIINLSPQIPSEASVALRNIDSKTFLIHFVSSNLNISQSEKQTLLETLEPAVRATIVLTHVTQELQLLELKDQIQSKVRTDMDKQQKEYFLQQQIRAIQEELGGDSPDKEIQNLREKGAAKSWSKEVHEHFTKELDRLMRVNPASPDYSVGLNYVQLMLDLPWDTLSSDNFDIHHAQDVFDEDHFGLEKVKKRILEYLAVLKLKGDMRSPIICLYGPPGVGKTSLGKSIARALGRKYVRMSLGGLHDESEIRGHRKTYIGAMPGRILQNLKKSGTSNPVFVLDEIDKLGRDFRGDPSSAMLEVLDPEQNSTFYDNYLELDYDLSKVLFVATANNLDTIQPALLDRMEIIEIHGYSIEEKIEIAKKHLLPKQREMHGMASKDVSLKAKIIEQIRDALYCSKICSYAQGFQLMREAQNEYKWKLNFGEIAQIWRGGCIIRARFLQKITEAFGKKPRLANLLLDPYFKKTVKKAQKNWRKVIALAVKHGIPVPTLGSALSYFDSYRTEDLPQNLLQGQRDFFGAHTYERKDKPRGEFFHIDWPDPKRPQIKA